MKNKKTLAEMIVDLLKDNDYIVDGFNDKSVGFHCDYEYQVLIDDLSGPPFTLGEILHNSSIISCCGEPVDKDYMMCPVCHEHI